ncbi:MAG: hypothetical protein ACRD2Z_03315 [Thermoanaerobaculia bacterium]
MTQFLDNVVARLPVSVRPYAKALVPLAVGVALVAADLTVSAVEVAELKTLAISVVTSLLVLATRNIGS